MRFAIGTILVAVCIAMMTGCDAGSSSGSTTDGPGGPGMTYGGKLGVDMGGGFVLPYDGSGPSLGFGY